MRAALSSRSGFRRNDKDPYRTSAHSEPEDSDTMPSWSVSSSVDSLDLRDVWCRTCSVFQTFADFHVGCTRDARISFTSCNFSVAEFCLWPAESMRIHCALQCTEHRRAHHLKIRMGRRIQHWFWQCS